MKLTDTPGRLRSLLPPYWRGNRAAGTAAEAPRAESFCAETMPDLDAVFSDALCLTGRREDAADLVVEAYLRAFGEYERSGRAGPPAGGRSRGTRAWLLRNLHGAFCDKALACAADHETPMGERP